MPAFSKMKHVIPILACPNCGKLGQITPNHFCVDCEDALVHLSVKLYHAAKPSLFSKSEPNDYISCNTYSNSFHLIDLPIGIGIDLFGKKHLTAIPCIAIASDLLDNQGMPSQGFRVHAIVTANEKFHYRIGLVNGKTKSEIEEGKPLTTQGITSYFQTFRMINTYAKALEREPIFDSFVKGKLTEDETKDALVSQTGITRSYARRLVNEVKKYKRTFCK